MVPQNLRDSLPHKLQRFIKSFLQKLQLNEWEASGQPVPPPHIIKVQKILSLQKKFKIETFVETGTFMGDMIDAVLHKFLTIYSIELDEKLFTRSVNIFKMEPHVKILCGDSTIVLRKVLDQLGKTSIFWLDAHYSGGKTAKAKLNTPVINELTHILNHKIKNHVILIDDARHFTGKDDYPSLEQLAKFLKKYKLNFSIENDIIQILPQIK